MNIVKDAHRVVVKVGSSTLTHETGKLNLRHMERLTQALSDFKNAGKEIILVTSGAVSAGRSKLGVDHRPASIEEKQAMAAVGQTELMRTYDRFFSRYGHTVAQILITRNSIEKEVSRTNAENTFRRLLQMGCIPIVNENDTVAYDEIEFGDNDTLSAHVAVLAHADVLINLSDIDGFYSVYACAGGAGSDRGTGGVITKLRAAEVCTANGIPMFLLNGADPDILYDLFEGKHVGTYFMSH